MGNLTGGSSAPPKYYTNKEAINILGDETWVRLRKQLERFARSGRYVDYPLFSRILYRRYERMPKALCESLFKAFAIDICGTVEIAEFISALAVLGGLDRTLTLRFLFRVYDVNGTGEIERTKVERLLSLAYGEKLNVSGSRTRQQLDDIFRCTNNGTMTVVQEMVKVLAGGKATSMSDHPPTSSGAVMGRVNASPSPTMNLRDFETYRGPLDVFGGWVLSVLSVFTEPLPARLLAIDRRYSALLEPEEVIGRFHVRKETCDQLRQQFYSRCFASSSSGGVGTVPSKAELDLPKWLEWTDGFISPPLAEVLFRAKTGSLKSVWRFVDFAEFCVTFATVNKQARATSVVFAAFHLSHSFHPSDRNGNDNYSVLDYYHEASTSSSSSSSGLSPLIGDESSISLLDLAMGFGTQEAFFSVLEAGKPLVDLVVNDHINNSYNHRNSIEQNNVTSNAHNPVVVALPPEHIRRPNNLLLVRLRHVLRLLAKSPVSLSPHPTVPSSSSPRTSPKHATTTATTSQGTREKKDNHQRHASKREEVDDTDDNELQTLLPHELWSAVASLEAWYLDNSNIISNQPRPPTATSSSSISSQSLPQRPLSRRELDGVVLGAYIDLVATHFDLLPGMRDLAVAASCLFGVRPALPSLEKEFVTELMLRSQAKCPQTRERPHGPPGSHWCVISKDWWDAWRKYVGGNTHHHNQQHSSSSTLNSLGQQPQQQQQGTQVVYTSSSSSGSSSNQSLANPEPPSIDNYTVLQKTNGTGQLLQGTMIGWHVEVVSPGVFSAIQAWYCGGPRITRSVIATDPTGSGKSTGTELELFPLRLVVCTCDERGSTIEHPQGNPINTTTVNTNNNNINVKSRPSVREVLVSKAATVGDLLRHLVRLDHDQSQGQKSGVAGSSHGTGQGTVGYTNAVVLPTAYARANADAADNFFSSGDKASGVGDGEVPIDISHVRLWNYAPLHWKHQFVIGQGPGQPFDHAAIEKLTLEAARLQDGQRVLLERRLPDGAWPRQRLQEAFEQQQQQQQVAVNDAETSASASSSIKVTGSNVVDNNNNLATAGMSSLQSSSTVATAVATGSEASLALSQWHGRRGNEGKVGLENLGNTCYLNSSVQALLHTEPLVRYFLSQRYNQHLNVSNKFGYGGRLAVSFGRLAHDLWTTNKKCVNPKEFCQDVGSLRQQFSGNDQHDAQELLAFLLDGLGEELNLVQDKPYVEHPDSDGRPDAALADIWWQNHLRRDLSVVQSLFTGQFKSVMTCGNTSQTSGPCTYTSARFEPFNFLTVPLHVAGGPEDAKPAKRLIVVHLVLQALPYGVSCAVHVDRNADVGSVMAAVRALAIACNTTSAATNDRDTKKHLLHPSDAAHNGSSGVHVVSGDVLTDQQRVNDATSFSSSSKTTARAPPGPVLTTAVTTLDGVDEHTLFVPAEVHHLRPKVIALYNASKRVSTIAEHDNLFLFQVDRWHPSCGNSSGSRSARGETEQYGSSSSFDINHRDGDGNEKPPMHRHDKQNTGSRNTGEDAGVTFLQGVEGASTLVLDALLQVSGAKAAMGDHPYLGTVTGGMLGGGQQQQQQMDGATVTGVDGMSTSLGHGDGYGCEPEVPHGIQCDEEEEEVNVVTANANNHRDSSSSGAGSSSSSTSPSRISGQTRSVSPPDSPDRLGQHDLLRTRDPTVAIEGHRSDHISGRGIDNSSSSGGGQAEHGPSVRVVFTQRRVRRSDGGGVETFRTESFGTPIMAVLPPTTTGAQVYQLVQDRVGRYLKPLHGATVSSGTDRQGGDGRERSLLRNLLGHGISSTSKQLGEPGQEHLVDNNAFGDAISRPGIQPSSAIPLLANLSPPPHQQAHEVMAGSSSASQLLRPLSTEDAMAGAPLPPRGFCLRLVTGGSLAGDGCSRCHWLARCQGCLIPDNDLPGLYLRDGETVAIDWNMVVYEELLDVALASEVRKHTSFLHAEAAAIAESAATGLGLGQLSSQPGIPLSRCMDKFTEDETIDGVVCPKCLSDQHMRKRFKLWRMPPVLVVQLKRFHFDRVSRRKLNNKVDFPREGLDMSPYLAHPSLKQQPPPPVNGAAASVTNSMTPPLTPSSLADDSTGSGSNSINQVFSVPRLSSQQPLPSDEHSPLSERPAGALSSSTSASPSSLYDLYGVVHHVGAMGGGHYVTTVRDRNTPAATAATVSTTNVATSISSSSLSSSSSGRAAETDMVSDDAASTTTTSRRHSDTSVGGVKIATGPSPAAVAPGGQWWCFNDDVVTLVDDPSEVCSASAYVLFYMRRDMWGKDADEIFEMSTGCSLVDTYATQQQQQQHFATRTASVASSPSLSSRGESAVGASPYHSNHNPMRVGVGHSAAVHRDLVADAIASSPASTPSSSSAPSAPPSSSYSLNHPHLAPPSNRINTPVGLGSDEPSVNRHQEGPSSRSSQPQYPSGGNNSSINDHSSNGNGREQVKSPSGKGQRDHPNRRVATAASVDSSDDNNCVAF